MPATPERAAFVAQAFRSLVQENSTVRTQYGKVARDTGDEPIQTYFDDMDDVLTMLNERAALLTAHNRLFRVEVAALLDLDTDLDMSETVPTLHLIDDELNCDMDVIVAAIESYDLEAGTTTLICWGTL